MKEYEFEGKTTEDAMEEASRQLNLPAEELNFDILEPGSAGIFGLVGGKKAKIRVTVESPEQADEEKEKIWVTIESPEQADEEKEKTRVTVEGPEQVDEEKGLEIAKETLENILIRIPVEATVEAHQMDGKLTLNIEGDRSGLLIGRKGKTLDALQFIVNKIVNKALERRVNVVVDSENYRKRREESLVQLALKMGDKAKRIRKPVATNPLNPHDRRIVHLALKEDEGLDTRSRGEGLLKKVVIIPKR